ncbi:hypothetical protein PV10_05067 [Exophiala mesophila]|uniref:DDHD domain-containing protein n=1 Tax=Exophiala mesophila TaxID=212818 RepID=A0A0D2A4I9_EXOME|nr:uncharacterized protein PV10_05067 [Exophiala mesophila]KIV93888.1 hypothetical protein PV10_05067 [Exophiala mesophila]
MPEVAPQHTYGPTCALHVDSDSTEADNASPTKVKAQFFYTSSLPIDDPLSPLPPISAGKASDLPPQPFSLRDNAALEEAWQVYHKGMRGKKGDSKAHNLRGVYSFPTFRDASSSSGLRTPASLSPPRSSPQSGVPSTSTTQQGRPERDAHVMLDGTDQNHAEASGPVDEQELRQNEQNMDRVPKSARRFSSLRRMSRERKLRRKSSSQSSKLDSVPQAVPQKLSGVDSDISGRPFARAPSGRNIHSTFANRMDDVTFSSSESDDNATYHRPLKEPHRSRSKGRRSRKQGSNPSKKSFVPVGISRLHLVEIPDLVMKPIYWSPINDTSTVMRATWFYKDTMSPIPVDVANRLEIGYEYMMPYADHYQEELQACIDNGADAEMKVVHKLWPADIKVSRPTTAIDLKPETGDVSRAFDDSSSSQGPKNTENMAEDVRKVPAKRLFASYSVVYVDAHNAQILRPSLLPSSKQNRRPLNSIRKGRQIGIAVVRGFDRQAWLKLHPNPKLNETAAHAKVGAYMSQSGDATTKNRRASCGACERESKTPQVSDLVLVIHGIGQKLSERVDSFHFTHAINGLRREFNVELSNETVKGNLKDQSGVMVLPVNWRLTVSFDDETKVSENSTDNKYSLKDITPDTLQGVRSLISDVMLDIPYYLSHHKEKMISAVIREANRVYRLWCRNNPGFETKGRVHLIAHSLGSVMAMEILSRQPTRLGKELTFDAHKPSEKMFEFDTTNLFSCGSPSGFFLLLHNASLVPRRGRRKPGMETEDRQPGIASEAQYGCLAVDNIYNICHRNDPISYLQNAAVDQLYAATLQPATIPSVEMGFMTRVGNTLRWATSSKSDPYAATGSNSSRPNLTQMPSTVEMETHDFTREEIAEKRMYLLNENGQIDWFLNTGGPLEIQYLNMLGAHSSYWVLKDFVRFLVVEIGRTPGKANTVEVLRAKKRREFKRASIT